MRRGFSTITAIGLSIALVAGCETTEPRLADNDDGTITAYDADDVSP